MWLPEQTQSFGEEHLTHTKTYRQNPYESLVCLSVCLNVSVSRGVAVVCVAVGDGVGVECSGCGLGMCENSVSMGTSHAASLAHISDVLAAQETG